MKEKISITLDDLLIREVDSFIDGIRIRNRSQAIEFLLRKSLSERRTAVILAGGPEEKLRVDNTFKPLVAIKGKTVIERMIENLKRNKFSEIYIVGRKNVLSEIFKTIGDGSDFGVEIKYVEEKEEKPITKQDTARTLKLLKGKINKPFLCLYCDILFDFNLIPIWNFHLRSYNIATLVLMTSSSPHKWGNVKLEGENIVEFVEKPKKSENYIVYTGIFVASPEIFEQKGNSLEYEIFPAIAKKGLLGGYVASGKCEHVHELRNK
jgi:NDP-sugar pyrophosphorylase family protein